MENAFFEVEKVPIKTDKYGKIGGKFAVVNKDNGHLLGIVSENYKPVLNKWVYDLFKNTASRYDITKEVHHLDKSGRKWACDFILGAEELKYMIAEEDLVSVALRVFNAYDGRNTFGYHIFGYRWMCENGMIFGKIDLAMHSFKHFEGKEQKLIEDFSWRFKIIENNTVLWKKWAEVPFSVKDMENFLADKEYVGDRLKKDLLESYRPKKMTAWEAYNLLTFFSTHKSQTRKNISGIFSHKYRVLSNLVDDFYELNHPSWWRIPTN